MQSADLSKKSKQNALALWSHLKKDLKRNKGAYLLVLPIVIYYILFHYKPLYGIIIAFKDYSPAAGILESDWATSHGFQNFIDFFDSYYFVRILKNTLVISLTSLILGFPAPIIFALLLNELRSTKFKRLTQTISYMPHFISTVVIAGMIRMFVSEKGVITAILSVFGMERIPLLSRPEYFVPIYVLSGIWQGLGWGAIIYLAAFSGIDQELYEAAELDGANRWQQTLHVTLPGISGTIIVMLLLNMGSIMNVGYEKIILLYNEGIYETADVISTFVYRKGLLDFQWSYSAAVGLFNSVVNFIIIIIFNKISKKATEISLW